MKEEIKICVEHPEYEVPLLWTFAFIGAEFWCPHCGYTSGMFGAGKDVKNTPELSKRHDDFKEQTQEYLHAVGVKSCIATTWQGEKIHPSQLPEEEKQRLLQIRSNWEYGKLKL